MNFPADSFPTGWFIRLFKPGCFCSSENSPSREPRPIFDFSVRRYEPRPLIVFHLSNAHAGSRGGDPIEHSRSPSVGKFDSSMQTTMSRKNNRKERNQRVRPRISRKWRGRRREGHTVDQEYVGLSLFFERLTRLFICVDDDDGSSGCTSLDEDDHHERDYFRRLSTNKETVRRHSGSCRIPC